MKGNHSLAVVIATHNQLNFLETCVEIVKGNFINDYPSGQLIVIDINSNDGTFEWLKHQSEIFTLHVENNISLSQAYNIALKNIEAEMVLFLKPDVFMTQHTISRLERQLYSKSNLAAVAPITKGVDFSNLQEYDKGDAYITTLYEFNVFANKLYINNPLIKLRETFYLYDFCLLIKFDVLNNMGNFDEAFLSSCMHDIDLSYRLLKAGYKLGIVPNVFVYDNKNWMFEDLGYNRYNAYCVADGVFKNKWNFAAFYSSLIREDLLRYIDYERSNLSILDVGCGIGADFYYIKNKNYNAELCGVELDKNTAELAKLIADVRNENLETISIPEWEHKFDYIVMGDIIEHLVDPWSALKKLKVMLKSDGCIIASIPNIMNVVTMYHILSGKFTYEDSGILDRTHMRFFTKYEIEKMFNDCGYDIEFLGYNQIVGRNEKINEFENEIMSMKSLNIDPDEFNVMQYIIKATKM